MPMDAHIASGMFGAVVIDRPHLPPVAHSYVLAQSELYLGPQGGTLNLAKLHAERPAVRHRLRGRQLPAAARQPGGSQALFLGPAQGGFVELSFPQPGHYPFITHLMTDAEHGAHRVFEVTR